MKSDGQNVPKSWKLDETVRVSLSDSVTDLLRVTQYPIKHFMTSKQTKYMCNETINYLSCPSGVVLMDCLTFVAIFITFFLRNGQSVE